LRTLVLAGVGAAAIGLSRIQRSRLSAISGLVSDRTALLTELLTMTDTEHRKIAENLHDGALQYILAARMDLEDARELSDPDAFDRLDQALTQSSRLLRSTVSELHPAVLEQSGLAAAVSQLARTVAERADLDLGMDTTGWPETARTANDLLLFGTARELLSNVARHARASTLSVELSLRDGNAQLIISDDGVGADPGVVARRVGEGHIGLESHRIKIEAAGGEFDIQTPSTGGTVVRVVVPAPQPGILTAG
jgi:two-component system NarL family sensor kinase